MKRLLLVLIPAVLSAQVVVDTVIRLPSPTFLQYGFYAPEVNKLYLHTMTPSITVVECSTYQVIAEIPYPIGQGIAEYVWNWRRKKLYFHSYPWPLAPTLVIDAVADTIVESLPLRGGGLAYVSEFDQLWACNNETLLVYDCATDTVVRRIPSPVPQYGLGGAVSWDSVGHKVYVDMGEWESPSYLAVYDYLADSFVKIIDVSSVCKAPSALDFFHPARKAYLRPSAPPPYAGYAGVIDTDRDTLLRVYQVQLDRGHLNPIAINTRDGKAYIAGSHGGPGVPETLWVIDCFTDSVLKKVEYMHGWGSYWTSWVPWSNRIYMDGDHDSCIVVLDCETDSIIVPRLQLGYWGGANIQVDPIRERTFVIGAESATVHVLRDVESGMAEPSPAGPAQAPSGLQVRNAPGAYELRYAVASPCRIVLTVHDLLGREVRRLVAESQAAGEHRIRWDRTDAAGTPVAQGVYVARLALLGTSTVRKLVVQR